MNKKLIILEMANNHMGNLAHGQDMIKEFSKIILKYQHVFDFAWKFQFRDIPTFIHKDYFGRMDIKYVKRFKETRLSKSDFQLLKDLAEKKGFKTLCTGFDEVSINQIESMDFDIIKIASCSLTDWPLLERISLTEKPIIISTAGGTSIDIDRVVTFFKNRKKNISLMHCVGEYPTKPQNLNLNQIKLLKSRFSDIPIGYSTHEEPDEFRAIQMAFALGAEIAEKHVALPSEKYDINAYSVTPDQLDNWLASAMLSIQILGPDEYKPKASDKELSDLRQFKRGVFLKKDIKKGQKVKEYDLYYAWPNIDGQLVANDISKFLNMDAKRDLIADQPLMWSHLNYSNSRDIVYEIVDQINSFIDSTNVMIPKSSKFEISHHYGIEKFRDFGITMITFVNREYCKKMIIMLPGQKHPDQYHEKKEETFIILHGKILLRLDGVNQELEKGDIITITPGQVHYFETKEGAIIEEISSTHFVNDSFYSDLKISENKDRKTYVSYWK